MHDEYEIKDKIRYLHEDLFKVHAQISELSDCLTGVTVVQESAKRMLSNVNGAIKQVEKIAAYAKANMKLPKRTVRECASSIARGRAKRDSCMFEVWWSDAFDEINIIEITESAPPIYEIDSCTCRYPIYLKRRIYYPSSIIMLHPKEWEQVVQGKLKLPVGWKKPEKMERIYRRKGYNVQYGTPDFWKERL